MELQNKIEILIVDDLQSNLFALGEVLERSDVTVSQALSGIEALELMMNHDFCVAIIDVNMPGMSGFELAEMMRITKKTKNIPIIFVTATATEQSFSFKGYESGAVDFLIKPLDAHTVQSKVNVFIDLYRSKQELKTQLETISALVIALNLSKIQAEKATTSKSEFLANMSHEIRTPIGVILGFTELMKNPVNTLAENQDYRLVVERNSQHLLKLIDEILDLSKVETGKMINENIEFSLVDLLADFSAIMLMKAKEKEIKFHFNAAASFPQLIKSDPVKLRQILNNIGGNAVKFTDKGEVEILVTYVAPILKFEIKDSGIGITKAQSENLFKAFTQADASTTRKFGGNGLGLVLSRRLAEVLGGKLDLFSSDENRGSTFSFEIHSPLVPDTKMVGVESLNLSSEVLPDFNAKKQVLKDLKVLLVEDSPDNQVLISMYLRREGAIVTLASDGAQGVDMALTSTFDVILMDVQMPVLDGNEATRKLRQFKYTKPIIALTAHVMKSAEDKCMESGFDAFMTKPISRVVLVEALSKYLITPGEYKSLSLVAQTAQ